MVTALASYALLSFGSLFAILSPLATVPSFLAMTEGNTPAERVSMASRACRIAFAVVVVFVLFGLAILGLFRVTIPAFQIAGGIVILRVALEMVQGNRALKMTPEERTEGQFKEDISITPLAVPLLCGPGTITTALLLSSQAVTWFHVGILIANAAVIYVITFVLLRLASQYLDLVGEITVKVVTRLMGLLLVAIAIQFVLDGLAGAPGLGTDRLGD